MRFGHSKQLRADFPDLVAGVVAAHGIRADVTVDDPIGAYAAVATRRLAAGPHSEFPEIRAWRRAFTRMGLKPTQYRCAAEALLRRYAKEDALPRIHPLVDLCNAVSLAYAVPIAVLDLGRVDGDLSVRHAEGTETYLTFGGEIENPEPGEVSYVDGSGRAHARRWTNRQSGYSAVRDGTGSVLVVAEALHAGAAADVAALTAALARDIGAAWGGAPASAVLTDAAPGFYS